MNHEEEKQKPKVKANRLLGSMLFGHLEKAKSNLASDHSRVSLIPPFLNFIADSVAD